MKPKGTFRILHESIQKRPDLASMAGSSLSDRAEAGGVAPQPAT